jgi:hypothetical protein
VLTNAGAIKLTNGGELDTGTLNQTGGSLQVDTAKSLYNIPG